MLSASVGSWPTTIGQRERRSRGPYSEKAWALKMLPTVTTLSRTTVTFGPSVVDNRAPMATGSKAKLIAIAIYVECVREICGVVRTATNVDT